MYISVKALAMQEGCSISTVWANVRKMELTGMYPNATKESGGLKIDPEEYNNFLCRQRRLKINKKKEKTPMLTHRSQSQKGVSQMKMNNNQSAYIDNLPNSHFNRVSALCLVILLICIAIFMFGYVKDIHDIQVAALGGISTCGLILVALNPINEE